MRSTSISASGKCISTAFAMPAIKPARNRAKRKKHD
jgi:hypothetical protein